MQHCKACMNVYPSDSEYSLPVAGQAGPGIAAACTAGSVAPAVGV